MIVAGCRCSSQHQNFSVRGWIDIRDRAVVGARELDAIKNEYSADRDLPCPLSRLRLSQGALHPGVVLRQQPCIFSRHSVGCPANHRRCEEGLWRRPPTVFCIGN